MALHPLYANIEAMCPAEKTNGLKRFEKERRMLNELPRLDYDRVERQRMSIEHKIEQIRSFFRRKPKLRFSELIARESDRYDVVLTFVSVLELVKQAAVRVRQPKQFGDIEIVLKGDRSQGS